MFFPNEDSDLNMFVDTWMEASIQDKDNIEINVCKMLKINMKEAIRRASAINNQGIKLPYYDRKHMKKLRKLTEKDI